ncbi:MAG: NAD-dependent epimerase/dehydratase family protein, partial [Acidimicrobiia bacterium]|nr:NAD-dependent epimerase/dehydratase family protein [Acidimicrobiia bacterium]
MKGSTRVFEGLDVEIAHGDLLDPDSLRAAFAGMEVVYHLAGVVSILGDAGGAVPAINVEGAGNAARAALECGARRMVHCSSVHAFDLAVGTGPLDETAPRVPAGSRRHSAYDRSMADGERRVREAIGRGLDA